MNNNHISLNAWLIWLTASVFYLYEFVLRSSPGVITHELMRDFGVMSGTLGILTSSYYYAYTPLQVPCGLIVDKLGPRKIITLSALLCAIGAVVFGMSASLASAQFGRFLIGAGSACAFLSCIKLGSEWFPPSKIAMVAGLTNAMGTLGGTFSGYPFAVLSSDFGWRNAMIISAFIGIGVMALSWIVIRDHNPKHERSTNKNYIHPKISSTLRLLLKDKQFWLISLYACLTYLPISVFCELWAVPFLMKLYDISNVLASKANIMLYMGTAVGSILLANISDRIKSRKLVMIGSVTIVCLIFILIIFFSHIIPLNIMYSLFFSIGFFSGAQVISFACVNEIYPSSVSGTSAGLMNTIVTLGPIIVQPLFGFLLDFMWEGELTDVGLPCYSLANYQVSILMLLILVMLGIFSLSFAKETFGLNKDHLKISK